MPKYVREGRMGPPMSYKTGAVVGTYPRPLLHLGGDPHGLDVVPSTAQSITEFKSEITQKDIIRIDHSQMQDYCNKATTDLPKITHINFYENSVMLSDLYTPTPDNKNFPAFNKVGNQLIQRCPWKTVVVDPVTALSTIILGHVAASQPAQIADPRKWAYSVGEKVRQTIAAFNMIKAHVVFIMHSETEKDELTSKVSTSPMIYSKNRQIIAGLFAQFLFAAVENGKPIVWTQPQGFCTGIGMRWPLGLPAKCGADFQSIYGAAVKSGEVEV